MDRSKLAELSSLQSLLQPGERLAVTEHAAYLHCAGGLLKSKAGGLSWAKAVGASLRTGAALKLASLFGGGSAANPSLVGTATGKAGPRGHGSYHRPRGPSASRRQPSAQTLGLTSIHHARDRIHRDSPPRSPHCPRAGRIVQSADWRGIALMLFMVGLLAFFAYVHCAAPNWPNVPALAKPQRKAGPGSPIQASSSVSKPPSQSRGGFSSPVPSRARSWLQPHPCSPSAVGRRGSGRANARNALWPLASGRIRWVRKGLRPTVRHQHLPILATVADGRRAVRHGLAK